MNKLLTILFILFLNQAHAQDKGDTSNYPYWWEMMQDRTVNYYNTQSAFEKYWENRPYMPHSGYKVFKRWEHFWRSRVNPDGTFPPADRDMVEFKKFLLKNNALRAANGNFMEMGPRKLPANSTGQPNGLGRINAVAFHPTNVGTIFIGAPQGGVWKTTDGGTTWSVSGTDILPSLGASTIAIDSANPSIMYLGTGDRDANDAAGIGVYKSINGGTSWSASNAGMGNVTVTRILINSRKNTTLLAATSTGVFKSYNSGANWTKKTTGTLYFKEMVYKPGDTATVYATEGGKFYRSVNGGETWSQISTGFGTGITRMVIAVTKANSNMVYVVASNSSRRFQGFFTSSDNGTTFTSKSTTPNILGYNWNGSDNGGQAEYDLALCVNPNNANQILVGGINVFYSGDGGSTWACRAHWVGDNGLPDIHADQHIFEINPLNNRTYFGNDGGLYYSDDFGVSYTDVSSGIGIAQIYKLSQNPLNPNSIMNGYQDNGTSIYRGSWTTVIGGDGMECIIDPIDTTTIYGALYYGDIRRKIGAGAFNTIAKSGTNGITESGGWVTPYELQPANNNTMMVGYKNIWRSTNVRNATPTWTRASSNGGGNIISVKFGNANTAHAYYYRNNALLFRTLDINAASPVWDSVSTPMAVESIETHPTDPNRIFVCGSNRVLRSSNRGATWTDITFNLPNTSMNHIVMDKFSKEGLYVSTDVGLYYKDSTMANWILYNTGFPTGSRVNESEIYYHPTNSNLSRISSATYGRGTWQSDLYMTQTQPVVNFTVSDTAPCTSANVTLNDISTPACDFFQWTITPATFSYISGNANSKNPVVKFNSNGNYTVTLFARRYGDGYNTVTKTNYIKVGTSATVSLGPPSINNFCAGDSALITASGSTNYSWAPAGSCSAPTSATTYLKPTVTTTYIVTGYNGTLACGDTESVTIIVKPAPTINITGANTICSLQTTTLTASGISNYTWTPNKWLNTTSGSTVIAKPDSNITYTVSGPGVNGCIGSKNIAITVNPRPTISIAGNKTFCTGGNTTLTASGAGNYAWTPATGLNTAFGPTVIASPINSIQYKIVGSVAGCFDTAKVNISVVPAPTLTINADRANVCLGDSARFDLKGGITYTINPTANTFFSNDSTVYVFPTTSTTYTMEAIITPTCKDTKNKFMPVNPKPSITLTATKTNINLGDSTILKAGGAKTYTWSPSSGIKLINDSTVSAKPIDTTIYKLVGTNAFNCSAEKTIKIEVVKLSKIGSLMNGISIYPNPTKASVHINTKEALDAELYHIDGKKINSVELLIGSNWIDLSGLTNGIYILKVSNKLQDFVEYKIIKE